MDHPFPEDLARLVDEEPSAAEAAHLRDCAACAAELAGMLEQTAVLSTLRDPPVPSRLRSAVETALAQEGLTGVARGRRRLPEGAVRAAAAVAIFVTGALAGTFGVAPALDRPSRPLPQVERDPVVAAAADLESAEAEYLAAMTRYAELAGSTRGVDPLNRLVALEGIVLTTEAALREAPADPVINNFHLTAVGQRDAMLQRIESATGDRDEWF
jgi:hypothetical protein